MDELRKEFLLNIITNEEIDSKTKVEDIRRFISPKKHKDNFRRLIIHDTLIDVIKLVIKSDLSDDQKIYNIGTMLI